MTIEEEKNQQIKYLNELLNANPFNLEKYNSERIKYAKFCYKNNLSSYSSNLKDRVLEHLFVVSSTPIKYTIDEEVRNTALDKIKNGEPLTEEEINTVLEAVVQVARDYFSTSENLETASLDGACGLGQALTYFPLEEIGVPTTINNASTLPDVLYRHAFLTCIFKTRENGQPVRQQYLIDTTYRQFFTSKNCTEAKFYTGDSRFKDRTSPDAGYFLIQSEEGISFSEELLKKGYIKLTEETAKLYGLGFSCQTLSFSNMERKNQIIGHTGKEYLDAINNPTLQGEIDYDYEELFKHEELPILYRSTIGAKSK